jgi:hypothetical protein
LTGFPLDYWPLQTVWSPAWRRVYVACHYGSSIAVIRDSLGGGVEERGSPLDPRPTPAATVVRGVLHLGAGHDRGNPGTVPLWTVPWDFRGSCPKPVLLDISGRKVMSLSPGPNDVRHLPAGVYFMRAANGEGRMASAKVVVQR